jgi:hypothetical protein
MTDWRIITGDCIETMASMTPGTARLMPPDPPYNQGVKYGPHCDHALSPEQLQRQADVLAVAPERWMPWNYRDALA